MENNQKLQSHQFNRYKYIIENIKDVIWELNRDFAFTFASPNAKEMAGYEVEELIGRKLTDFLADESKDYFSAQVTQHLNKRLNWGGDEFIIILPGSNWESTKTVAEKLRNIIQAENFGIGDKITISSGFGEYIADENADQLVLRMDKALYQAKIHGRNKIVAARLNNNLTR